MAPSSVDEPCRAPSARGATVASLARWLTLKVKRFQWLTPPQASTSLYKLCALFVLLYARTSVQCVAPRAQASRRALDSEWLDSLASEDQWFSVVWLVDSADKKTVFDNTPNPLEQRIVPYYLSHCHPPSVRPPPHIGPFPSISLIVANFYKLIGLYY